MGVSLSHPFRRFGILHKIPKINLDHCLLDTKGIMQKFQPFSCDNSVSNIDMALSRPFGWYSNTACLTKFPKLVWTFAYSMQSERESCKQFQPFSCNNQSFYKWAWPCRAPHDADQSLNIDHAQSPYI